VANEVKAEVLKGHLDGLLLAALEAGPRHGYAIMEALRDTSGGRIDLPTGTIYPALHRLERAGLIRGDWSQDGGRPRRTYRLTASGRKALGTQRSAWREFATAVNAILEPPPWPRPATR
jgi:PadR family transcriptional regulator, regulatory protein PadR